MKHIFAVIKRVFGFTMIRYRGLDKNATAQFMLCALTDLYPVALIAKPNAGKVRIGIPVRAYKDTTTSKFSATWDGFYTDFTDTFIKADNVPGGVIMPKRRNYSQEFKREAVEPTRIKGVTTSQIAGISVSGPIC